MTQTILPGQPSRRSAFVQVLTRQHIAKRQLALFSPNSERITAEPAGTWVLSGNYEVIIPGGYERIIFADTLAEAAHIVAESLDGDGKEFDGILHFIEAAAKSGDLAANEYGVRVHRVRNGQPWIAKVRGPQSRPQPLFKLDEAVHTDALEGDLPGNLLGGKAGKVSSVYVTNHASEGRQYVYTVGNYQLRENRLIKAPAKR